MPQELNKGFAVVIDEEINTPGSEDLIIDIVDKIQEKGIPVCKYDNLKDARKCLDNFLSVNFLILDWKLMRMPAGIETPELLEQENEKNNVEFLDEFRQKCFAPVFIFTNESTRNIEAVLQRETLMKGDPGRDFIHVKAKKHLIDDDELFRDINNWVNGNPAIYSLKFWEKSFLQAKNETFWFLFNKSPIWPKILLRSFELDRVDESSNMNDVIYSLIKARAPLSKIDKELINQYEGAIDREEIKDVVRGTMYLPKENIPEDIKPGDIFQEGQLFYLNIRPECDTVLGRTDGQVYLLEGNKLSAEKLKKQYEPDLGVIVEKVNEAILFGLEGNDFVSFKFREVKVRTYNDIASQRVCRLLHPHINYVQQKFSSYVGRFGLPRLPKDVLEQIVSPPATQG